MDFNQRADDKTNGSILILGNSGQGKSYLLKLLLCNLREAAEEPQPNKKFVKVLAAVVAIAAVIAIAALVYMKMNTKDPKQVVIDAFENVFPEGQVYPSEELFGLKDFAETVKTADSQGGLTLKMDSCSDETVNTYAGSGLRFETKDDKTNGKSFFNMGVIYNGMDLANLNAYYGDDTLMLAVPRIARIADHIDEYDQIEEVEKADLKGHILTPRQRPCRP